MKKTIAWPRLLTLILIAFFLLGAFMNVLGPESIAQDFAKWGYPPGFRYVTGSLELLVGALLAASRYRNFGILLGGLIMMSAMISLLIHLEFLHAVMPAMVLLALCLLFKMHASKR